MLLHPSFGRKNKDISSGKLGSWQIEDMARLIGCFAPLLFRPYGCSATGPLPLPPRIPQALGHLRAFWQFHTRRCNYGTQQQLVDAACEAREHLLSYGKLMEEVRHGVAQQPDGATQATIANSCPCMQTHA
jgi:hypothetical protein